MARGSTVAAAAVFTAFVAAATMIFTVSIPATNGYFNIGEIMVYTSALLMGPYVGAIAGGFGSMISDLVLGPVYAPGTLVIKGIEGFIVGYLGNKFLPHISRRAWQATAVVIAAILGSLVAWIGSNFLSGDTQITLGLPLSQQVSISFITPVFVWVSLGILVFALVTIAGFLIDERVGWIAISVLVGGIEMVTGYFLYESYILNIGIAAASAEIPFNVAQATIGLIVSIPLVKSIKRIMGTQKR